ncbi:TonB-dependent receptor plug domain-containing protein [Vibrio sp. MarTm2]|uniref:TonB-dependent receptor n=1 Tax=Vibrio sp. MarTm2 TaxID=2998831 RepID=UPI0022CD827C|nr:TonB-dependent receptor plug domain-containing protein [Vibrio sp. MarTm2]MDA0130091.1 TonB-dependent receptor plug domain-containing protein [Vibrio sp. MarTm2]
MAFIRNHVTAILQSKPQTTKLATCLAAAIVSPWLSANTGQHDQASDSVTTLDTIVVIGEKTERSIYETASSVKVFDESTIESTPGATEVADLIKLAPNVVDSGVGNSMPSVRGIDGSGPSVGGLASFAGTSTRLNLSIDGRSLTYSEIAFGPPSLWDVDQVEVHLGPQSYIQGQNASAGAIVIKTMDPSHDFEVKARAGYGQHDYTQTSAMINAPIISDQLAFRLSVDHQSRNSHLDLESYNPAGDSREFRTTTARAKLLLEPSAIADFKTMLTFDSSDTHAPQSENEIGASFPAKRPVYETGSRNVIWDIDWQFADAWTFENSVVYSQSKAERITDPEGWRADFITEGTEMHIEPLLRYHGADNRLTALLGARYYRSKQDDLFTNTRGESPMDGKSETKSAFAEATYAIIPEVEVTLAGRFERENKQREVEMFKLDYDETETVFLPKFDIAFRPDSRQTYGFNVAKGYNSGGAGVSFHAARQGPMKPYAFETESVWNYEFYTRHGLNDGKIELTSNVFYNDYEDMQIQQNLADGYVAVQNLDSAHTYGAELGARWLPSYQLELFTNLGLLKTRYKQAKAAGGDSKELPRAPALTANMGALYAITDNLEISGNAQYTGKYYSDLKNSDDQEIKPYWTANMQLSYLFENGRASLYATNLFDSDKHTLVSHHTAVDQPIRQAPRTIGANLELFF